MIKAICVVNKITPQKQVSFEQWCGLSFPGPSSDFSIRVTIHIMSRVLNEVSEFFSSTRYQKFILWYLVERQLFLKFEQPRETRPSKYVNILLSLNYDCRRRYTTTEFVALSGRFSSRTYSKVCAILFISDEIKQF